MVGEVGYEYQHPDDRDVVAAAIESIQTDPDDTQVIESRFRHADDSWCWIEATLQNRLDDPDISGILVNSRDISERKQQERQYQRLADEYRTLLESVEDNIFFLTVESTEAEHVFRFERLNQSYEEQTGIATDEVRGETPTDVFGEDLGAELRANYRRCVEAREPISYEEEVTITGDRSRLRYVFENLFRNAIECGGTDVTIRVGRVGDRGIYVEDTGSGIPEDAREAVFDPGYTSTGGGTGFGLTIAKRIAEAHGWQVAIVDSDDGGARFEFTDIEPVSD